MRSVVWQSRVLAMALIFAAGGFCVGVSRSLDAPAPQVAARMVGSGALVFTNPVVAGYTTEYDLGDAMFGSTIARYVTAAGGLKPYRFTSEGPQSLSNVLAGYRSTLQLGTAGVLAGSVPPRVPVPFPLTTVDPLVEGIRFAVTVTDAQGTTLTKTASGMFNLALFPPDSAFRFAMDTLPTARLGANYLAAVDTIGGVGTKTYSIVSVAGAASSQEALGIYCTPDGTVTGRPLVQGTFTVTMRCVDSTGVKAKSRNLGADDQVFTFVVEPETVTSSDLTTLQVMIRGALGGKSRDTLRYRGVVNALGLDNFSLVNSDFSFRVSGMVPADKTVAPLTVTGRLNEKGQFSAVLADLSKVKARVNAKKGTVDLTISKGTFADALVASTIKPEPALNRRAFQIAIGDAVASSEILDLVGKLSSSRYSLDYRLGTMGANAAGAFQITGVKGKDLTTFSGQAGDSWFVNFIAAPRSAVVDPSGLKQGFDGVTGATVRIGGGFVEALASAQIKSTSGGVKFSGGVTGVKKLTLSTRKFAGRLQTLPLAATKTGIPLARDAARVGTVFFPLGLDLVRGTTGAPFSGEHARRIFGMGTQYKDQPPSR